jgi:zinc protease
VLETTNQVAAIMVGWPGMRITNTDDRVAIEVLDTIISGWQLPRGWLHSELRGRQLVYVVHAYNWVGLAPGTFAVYAATQPGNAQEVLDIIHEKIDQTLTHEYTEEEIREAVNIILTAELLDNQTMAALAMQSTLDELYGLGYDYRRGLEQRLRAVTAEDLRRVAETYLAGPAVESVTTPQPAALKEDQEATAAAK